MSQKKKTWLVVGAAVALAAVLLAVWFAFGPKGAEGSKNISVTVVYGDASSERFDIATDAEFLRGALEERDLIAGDESEYGLFVKTVNGVEADDAKQEWWRFTKGGEELMTGVDATPIADGDAFEITLTTGW